MGSGALTAERFETSLALSCTKYEYWFVACGSGEFMGPLPRPLGPWPVRFAFGRSVSHPKCLSSFCQRLHASRAEAGAASSISMQASATRSA